MVHRSLWGIVILGVLLGGWLGGAIPYASAQTPTVEAAIAAQSHLWFGTLDFEVRRLRFAVKITPVAGGNWEGELRSLDEGERVFPLSNIKYTDHELAFDISATQAHYQGAVDEQRQVARGQWKQHGEELELVFERVKEIPERKVLARWVGQLDAVIQKLDVAFLELENGKAILDSISQKTGGLVASFQRNGDEVVIEVPAVQGEFRGTSNAAGDQLTGKWKQGFITLNLVLSKSEVAEYQLPRRPQTPQAPFPYQVTEVEFQNTAADIKLAGTLTQPFDVQGSSAVVLISGSGPQDRDETIADHRPFAVLADYLTRRGLSVLRFDDRGIGRSQGDFQAATSQDFASDVAAAVAFLRTQPAIDPDRIGLCGHSEGALIAPILAARDPRIAFLVLMAGPGVNGAAILQSQARLISEAVGTPSAEVAKQVAIQQSVIGLALQTPTPTKEAFSNQARLQLAKLLETSSPEEQDQYIEAAATQLLNPWMQTFLRLDPAEALAQVHCPVLAITGAKDLQVDPSLNMPAIEAALTAAGNSDYQIEVLPSLNHLFQTCQTGALAEYGEIEETIAPAGLQCIAQWVLTHRRTTPTSAGR